MVLDLAAVREETRRKLHPALLLSAEALHAIREKSREKSSPGELGDAWEDVIHALNDVKTKFLDTESPTQKSLVENEIQTGKALSLLIQDADPHLIFGTSNPLTTLRTALGFFGALYLNALHLNAPRNAQDAIGHAKHALESIRTNRSPLPKYRKICHNLLLLLLWQCGALRGITSYVCDPCPLTFPNLKDFFDYTCPTCRDHTPDALRQMVGVYAGTLKAIRP